MKRLIITSDDFGVTHSVNMGILEGFKNGVLTSSNFMVPTPWFPEAVKLTKDNNLPVGVHLTLTCEWTNMKFGPITNSPSLKGEDGYFYSSYKELTENMKLEEVEAEYRAQIERVISLGIKPTHVETHMMTPKYSYSDKKQKLIFDIAGEVAKEFGLIYTYGVENDKLKYFNDWFELTHKTFDELKDRLRSWDRGDYHLICHCGYDSDDQRSLCSKSDGVFKWASECRERDLNIITSDKFKEFLKRENIEVIGIKELLK